MTVVSAELMEPFPDRPAEGFFLFNTEFSPMASPTFEIGRQSEFAIELGRVVERGLRESKAIDPEELCILAGKKVWQVRVDIHVLDHAGNLIDAAGLATVAALLHFRRPQVSIHGDSVVVHSAKDREPVSLSIHHIPICVTFAFFEDGTTMAVDPTLKEEQVMDGRMTMTLNAHREVCAVQKAGAPALSIAQILACARAAAVKVAEISELLHKALRDTEPRSLFPKQLDLTPSRFPAELLPPESRPLPAEARFPAAFEQSLLKEAPAGAVEKADPIVERQRSEFHAMADDFLKNAEDLLLPDAVPASPAAASQVKGNAPADSESEEEAMVLAGDELKPSAAPAKPSAAAPVPKKSPKPPADDDLSAALKKKPLKKAKTSKK
jgi:exosome complex component RRP45